MQRAFLSALTTLSTVAEVPGYEEWREISARARDLADLFKAQPELPGVLLTRGGRLESAISRRYYLDAVGRYLGMDLYLPRPIELMMARFDELGGALVIDHDVPIPEAVRRGLLRRSELTFEPIVVRGEASGTGPGSGRNRLIDFGQLLLADSQVTAARSGQMRQILTTVTDGLLLAAPDATISGEYSIATEAILDLSRISGRSFFELLGEGLDTERAELGRDYLKSLFDPRIIESLVVKINPLLKVVWRRPGSRARVLSFRFARGLEEGQIRRVLVRVEDVTRAEELAAEIERERERTETRLTLAFAAVEIEPELLDAFLAANEKQRDRLLDLARRPEPRTPESNAAEIDALFRRVHALKGEAGLLRLDAFQSSLHRIEEELVRARDGAQLRRDVLTTHATEVSELVGEVRQLLARLVARAGAHGGDGLTRAPMAITPERRAAELAESLEQMARKIAGESGRRVELRSGIEPAALVEHEEIVRQALVQLVRNAVVHGIEPVDLRLAMGKEPAGTIQIVARRDAASGWIELVVQDDGRGLDYDAIRARGGDEASALPDTELVAWLYRPGFSTAGETTEHAGRGVGLDLVKESVDGLGGTIEVYSESGSYCAFRVLLPTRVWVTS